jgi:hypothetical protein
MGIAAAYGQVYMTRAYFYAKAGIVSTVSYSVVLFATLFRDSTRRSPPDPDGDFGRGYDYTQRYLALTSKIVLQAYLQSFQRYSSPS